MKTHKFKYSLLLTVIVLSFTTLIYSQDTPEPTNGEDISPEKSNGEPIPTEKLHEKPNPLEKQVSQLKDDVKDIELRLDATQYSTESSVQTVFMIFGAIVIITIVVMFFLSMRKIRQLKNRFENNQRQWSNRLNENDQRWEGQLKHTRQQGKDNTEKLEKIISNHTTIRNEHTNLQSTLSKTESRLDSLELTLANISSDKTVEKQPQVDNHPQLDKIIQDAQTQVELLALTYESGEPIDIISIENPTPSQNVVLILNLIARLMEEWENELKQSATADANLIQSLGYANQAIKDKLKEIRGPAPPLPTSLELDTDIANNKIQEKCNAYVSRYEGMLTGLQLGSKFDETEYNQSIPQFIKDRLFNGVARFIQYDNIPEQLNEFLQLVGFEIVPIEIGKTEVDARMHEIQGSRQTDAETGTVVEVILPGLRRISDGEVIQKPVVICGE